MGNVGHIATPETLFPGGVSEGLSQIEVMRAEVQGFLGKLKTNRCPGPDGIYLMILKEFKCEVVILITNICNLLLKSASKPENWNIP